MPAKSEKQYKFMQLVSQGKIKAPGLSKEKAKEFIMYGYPTQKRKKSKDSDKKDEERKKNKKALREIYK